MIQHLFLYCSSVRRNDNKLQTETGILVEKKYLQRKLCLHCKVTGDENHLLSCKTNETYFLTFTSNFTLQVIFLPDTMPKETTSILLLSIFHTLFIKRIDSSFKRFRRISAPFWKIICHLGIEHERLYWQFHFGPKFTIVAILCLPIVLCAI